MDEQLLHLIIVMYTITNENDRKTIQDFVEKSLSGTWINESTYSINRLDYKNVKKEIESLVSSINFAPSTNDFISVLYSAALTDEKEQSKRDRIIEVIIKGSRIIKK